MGFRGLGVEGLVRTGHVGIHESVSRVWGSRGHPYLETRNLEIRQALNRSQNICAGLKVTYTYRKITYTDIHRNRKNYIKLINK